MRLHRKTTMAAGGSNGTRLETARRVATEEVARCGRLLLLEMSGDRIHSIKPDGSDRKTIVTGCHFPDGIVVDAEAGHIYWTNMGVPELDDGSIERADLDGSDRRVIVPQGVTHTPKQIPRQGEWQALLVRPRGYARDACEPRRLASRSRLAAVPAISVIKPGGAWASLSIRCFGRFTGPKKARPTPAGVVSSAPTCTLPRARARQTAPTSKCCSISYRNQSISSSIW
jgi:hypothetical protein